MIKPRAAVASTVAAEEPTDICRALGEKIIPTIPPTATTGINRNPSHPGQPMSRQRARHRMMHIDRISGGAAQLEGLVKFRPTATAVTTAKAIQKPRRSILPTMIT